MTNNDIRNESWYKEMIQKQIDNMMNLTIGEYYYVRGGCNIERCGKISTKTIHGETTHTYLLSWPNATDINPYGIYIWDNGYAKLVEESEEMDRFYWSSTSVIAYRKLNKTEREPMEMWFKEKERRMQAWLDKVNERARLQTVAFQSTYEAIMHS